MLARAVIVVAIMFVAQAVASGSYPTCPELSPYPETCPGIPGCKEVYNGKCKKPQRNFECCFPGADQWKVGSLEWEESQQICVCKPGYGDPNVEYNVEEQSVKVKSYGHYDCKATCKKCAKGTYSEGGVCVPCDDGYTTPGTGATSVHQCSCFADGWTCESDCGEDICCAGWAEKLSSAKAAAAARTGGKRRLSSVNSLAPATTGSNARALLNAKCVPIPEYCTVVECPADNWCTKGKPKKCPKNTSTQCYFGATSKKACIKGYYHCDNYGDRK